MLLYLGGKMLGVANFGAHRFDTAAEKLRALGHEVFNPADHDRNIGFDPDGLEGTHEEMNAQGFDRRAALAFDMRWIAENSEGMICLDDWTTSPGAKAEVAFHQALYLPVWELDDFLSGGEQARQVPLLAACRTKKATAPTTNPLAQITAYHNYIVKAYGEAIR